MPAPSAAAERLAAQWVADALAADETIDFSVVKGKPQVLIAHFAPSVLLHSFNLSPRVPGAPPALVGDSSEFLVGAPDAARERVALRCLQELAAFAVSDEDGAAAAPSGMLRVDAARSCEDLLIELTGQVGSSISFERDRILPFRQAIQDFICIKKPTLPVTSLELLREVDPEIQSVAAPSPVDQSGIKKHDNNQSLCNVNHLHSNVDKPRPPTVSTELQPENLTHVDNETEIGDFQQCPIKPTVDFDQPCASDIRFYNQPREDAINAASVGASTTEKNLSNVDSDMSVAALSADVPASASCNATSQGNIVEPLSKKDMVDKTTVVQPQLCKGKSSNPNDGTCDQSLKDPSHENQTVQATMAPAFDRINDVLPTNTYEASHLVNQNLDGSASIPPVEKEPVHEELTLRAASGIPSVTCNSAMQEDKSGTNHPSTEHTTMFEEHIGTKSQLEVSSADKNKHTLYDDVTMLEKNTVCGGPNVQNAPEPLSCNVTLHDKISEANSLSKQNIETNTAEVQECSCSISVPNSSHDGDRKRAKQDSKKQTVGKTVAETSHVHNADDSFSGFAAARLLSMTGKMPFCSQVQEANDCLGVSQEQDLCIKCGKDGQLLQCSSCFLSAHDSCFGSSVTFEDSGQFYCPVCICTKATEAYQKAKKTYIEARKNLFTFLGTENLLKHHDELQTNGGDQLNVRNSLKRQKSCSQTKDDDLAHQGEESDRQRKNQKINAASDACNGVVIEKAFSVRNSDVAPMNKHSVLLNNSNQPHNSEKDHHVENTEAREDAGNGHSSHERRNSYQNRCTPAANPEVEAGKDAGNGHSSHERRNSSQNRCTPAANPEVEAGKDAGNGHSSHERRNSSQNRCTPAANLEVEADKEDIPTTSHQSENSDEIEASSSNDSGKRSSPPWRTMKHHKAKLQEREATAASNSRKAFGQQDQHMPSPSGKRKYAYPPKRYSNPVAPTGRRSKLCWTEEEEAALSEAMEKFTPRDNGAIPWVQILEHGRNVFHKTRLPCDLRVKWRNMKKKAGS